METVKKGSYIFSTENNGNNSSEIIEGMNGIQTSSLEVSGTGKLIVTNTGGSSASEGGMGSGSDDDREKGSLLKPGEKSGSGTSNDDSDTTFDPIKKNIKEAEKTSDKD